MQCASGTRDQRRLAVKLERAAWRSGDRGPWEHFDLPGGLPGRGWCLEVRRASRNRLYAVLIRPVATDWGEVRHLAVRTASSLEPPWRDKQRIKDELFGEAATAVEVMPPRGELIDAADMYHVWVLPDGFRLPFTIGKRG
jgi:hypothetical protein